MGIPQLQMMDLVLYRLAESGPMALTGSLFTTGHSVVAGGSGGSGIRRPDQTVTSLFSIREQTEQPQLVSAVISLPCHMIRAVCKNTRGLEGSGLRTGSVRKQDDP